MQNNKSPPLHQQGAAPREGERKGGGGGSNEGRAVPARHRGTQRAPLGPCVFEGLARPRRLQPLQSRNRKQMELLGGTGATRGLEPRRPAADRCGGARRKAFELPETGSLALPLELCDGWLVVRGYSTTPCHLSRLTRHSLGRVEYSDKPLQHVPPSKPLQPTSHALALSLLPFFEIISPDSNEHTL